MIEFNHFNFNVLDLEKSIAFYKEAIELSFLVTTVPVSAWSSPGCVTEKSLTTSVTKNFTLLS